MHGFYAVEYRSDSNRHGKPEPNRTIGVRLGSITERSIRYAG